MTIVTEDAQNRTKEFVSKDRSTTLRFAAAGFGIAVVFVSLQMLAEPSPLSPLNNILSAIFIILCPPVLLTFPLLDVKIGTGGFYLLWVVVALLNAGLYAVIGAAYVGLKRKTNRSATS
jgi:hypothetical protein